MDGELLWYSVGLYCGANVIFQHNPTVPAIANIDNWERQRIKTLKIQTKLHGEVETRRAGNYGGRVEGNIYPTVP